MAKSFYRSWAGGEITPELFGRLDLTKWQTGLRRCLNFTTLPHGPAARRPGTYFVNEAYGITAQAEGTRLIPFVFNSTQAVVIEFGQNYVRFHDGDGTLLEPTETITAISIANPAVLTRVAHGYLTGDWIYITSPLDTTYPLHGRFFKVANATANTYELRGLDGSVISSLAFPAPPAQVFSARVYTLTSPYSTTDVAGLDYAQDADVLTLTTLTAPSYELRRLGATSWSFTQVSFVPTLAAPGGVSCVATKPTPTNVTPQHYVVTAVQADLVTESLASVDVTDTNNLTIAGNYNTIAWAAVGGAARYYVYKQRGGTYGFIGQTTALSLVDDNILADTSITPPQNIYTLNTGANDCPQAVTHFERRRWFAGTNNLPQTLWATRNGTESNLTSSIPSRDDDGMEFRIAAQQQNAIRHLFPLSDLIALTVGGEFRIFADGGPAIAPSTISIKPQGFSGTSTPQPALTPSSALFVQAQGSRIRELAYDPNGTGYYRSIDVTLMAPHLFDGYTVVQLAYTRAPQSVLWAVRSDGVLLGLSYVPDQQVYAWHHHTTDGFYESVAVIPENNEDTLYLSVKRTVNGRTTRYIERLTPRFFLTQADAFFVDAGLTYSGAPTTTVRNLHHLEGKAVQVLADGAVVAGLTVVNGTITLPNAASKVHVGLGYNSDLITLPLAYESAPASGQGMTKNVSAVYMRVNASSVVKAGPSFDKLRTYPARQVSDPFDTPPALVTEEIPLSIDPSWNQDGSVCVRQDLPLPLTLVAMALETQTGG